MESCRDGVSNMMRLQWNPSFSASALHAAYCIAMGHRLVDARAEEQLHPTAFGLHAFACGLDGLRRGDSSLSDTTANQRRALRLWGPLLAYASEINGNQKLAEAVLRYALAKDAIERSQIDILAGWITEIEATIQVLNPKLVEQLELRIRPLRELWDGYGNGLMAHLRRMTESKLFVDRAEVVCVQPWLGGFGEAQPELEKVRIEGVLANPIRELPEVIRLTWLLGQLRQDRLGNKMPVDRSDELHRLAILPAVLAAGQVVELTQVDEPHLALAIEQWQIPVPGKVNVGKLLLTWWETYLQTKPAWDVGLLALHRMLFSAG